MTQTHLKIEPDSFCSALYVDLELEMLNLDTVECSQNDTKKKFHCRLRFINNCFSLKHKIIVILETDTINAQIYDNESDICNEGKNYLKIEYPLIQEYWKGPQKQINRLIGWKPDLQNSDFTLEVSTTIVSYPEDILQNTPGELTDSLLMFVYGEEK